MAGINSKNTPLEIQKFIAWIKNDLPRDEDEYDEYLDAPNTYRLQFFLGFVIGLLITIAILG